MKNEIIEYLCRLEEKIFKNNQRITQMSYESRRLKERLDEEYSDRLYNYRLVKLKALRTLLLINNSLLIKHHQINKRINLKATEQMPL